MRLAIIPARGGSKGIKMKNLKPLRGRPLVFWSIDVALECADRVVVSTEDEKIKSVVGAEYGADIVVDRPLHLADDNVHAINVVLDVIKQADADFVSMLLPTAPLRSVDELKRSFDIVESGKFSSVVGVCKTGKPSSSYRSIKNGVLFPVVDVEVYEQQRQDAEIIYEVNGAIFTATKDHILQHKSFHQGGPYGLVMDKTKSIDINDLEDFRLVEALCKR